MRLREDNKRGGTDDGVRSGEPVMTRPAPSRRSRRRKGLKALVSTYAVVAVALTALLILLEGRVSERIGLRREVYQNTEFSGAPFVEGVSHDVTLDFLSDFPTLPRRFFSVRWHGFWHVPEAVEFELHGAGDDRLDVWLDDELVIRRFPPADMHTQVRTIRLLPGLHALRIEYSQHGGARGLHLKWAPPREGIPLPVHRLLVRSLPVHSLFPLTTTVPDQDNIRLAQRLVQLERIVVGVWSAPAWFAIVWLAWHVAWRLRRSRRSRRRLVAAAPHGNLYDPLRQSRERALVTFLTIALVFLRSGALVFGRAPEFDSDQAIVGLMAKHLSELEALPIFFYGQNFMLAIEAWLAAPLFLLFGPSVTALKIPLLGIHVTITILLLRMMEREAGLRPLLAFVPTLFFVLAPIGSTTLMLQANGGNVEPFLYVLVLWLVRRRPLVFGTVLGIGYLNREFTVYGLGALLLIEAANGTLFRRSTLQDKGLAFLSFAAMLLIVEGLRYLSSPLGPGTTVDTVPLESGFRELINRACGGWSDVPLGLASMVTTNMNTLFTGGTDWMWLLLGGTSVAACARLATSSSGVSLHKFRVRRIDGQAAGGAPRGAPPGFNPAFPAYLLLVGLLAAVVPAVSRCGLVYDRYVLLALLALAGVAALYLKAERRAGLRAAFVGVVLLWGIFNAAGFLRYSVDHFTSPPDPIVELADHLVSNGVHFATSDYQTAYYLTFLTAERVIVASSDYVRILQYQSIVAEHSAEAVTVGRTECDGGSRVHGYWICRPSE